MKCPACVNRGTVSRVYTDEIVMPPEYHEPYYDESGALIVSQATGIAHYHCSNGHQFSQEHKACQTL